MSARPSHRGAAFDDLRYISNQMFRFSSSGGTATNNSLSGSGGRSHSSLGFSHRTDHMCQEDERETSRGNEVRGSTASSSSGRSGSGKRKVIMVDGISVDGQFIQPFASADNGNGYGGDFSLQQHQFAVAPAASNYDPLSALSAELTQIHGSTAATAVQPPAKKRREVTNFNISSQSRNQIDDTAVNPFRRRTLPDACCFHSIQHVPTASSRVAMEIGIAAEVAVPRPVPVAAAGQQHQHQQQYQQQASSRFCERCGSSNVQLNFLSSGNECLKAEVWGTRNVDEHTSSMGSFSESAGLKCFTCFHITNSH